VLRVLIGASAGIGAGHLAPTIVSRLTRIDVTSFSQSGKRNRLSGEMFASVAIFVAVFTLISVVIENWALVIAAWVLSLGLISTSWIDARTHRIPRNLSYTTFGIGAPLLVIAAITENDMSHVVNAVIGAVVATGLVGFLYLIGRGAMGSGDVRLAPVIGLYTGWISVGTVVLALVVSFFLAAMFAVVLLITRRASRSDQMPLGPFLAWGTLAVFVYSAANYGM
ncbi:MAG: A24 family peptidase, partial [Actinomycetota bacterium]